VFNAPGVPNTPFASVTISTGQGSPIYLPNRSFSCVETAQEFQCQAEIQNRVLTLSMTKGINYKYDLRNCRAQYDDQAVVCSEKGLAYAPMLAEMYELALDLPPQQRQALQQKYWGINALMALGELRLFWISTALSLIGGFSLAFLTWLYPGSLSKGFASLVCGLGVYRLIWGWLGRVPYDVVTPYGFTPDTWGSFIHVAAIAIGLVTIIATALVLWRNVNRGTRILLGTISSIGIFNLCWLSLSMSSNHLPFLMKLAETVPDYPYSLFLLFTGISLFVALTAAIWLWQRTPQSIKRFLCLSSGFGAVALMTHLFLSILLGLGYAD